MTGAGAVSGGHRRTAGLAAECPGGAGSEAERVADLLHQLRVGGAAGEDGLGEALGWDRPELAGVLSGASSAGLIVWTPQISAWRLTAAGRVRVAEALRVERCDEAASRSARGVLQSLDEENARVLEACTAWQLCSGQDAVGGTAVVDTLDAARRRVDGQLRLWSASAARASRYRSRLSRALRRARAGDGAWIAGPRVDCFHGVWFQLHEDLLATLGLTRGAEPE